MAIACTYFGRRAVHALTRTRADFMFVYISLDDGKFALLLRQRFPKNKRATQNFQFVSLWSHAYAWSDSEEVFWDKYQDDIVLQLHRHFFMLNTFEHADWRDALRCPAMQPGATTLPFLPLLDAEGLPTYESMRLRSVQDLFAQVALAAGYPGMTPHGCRSGKLHDELLRAWLRDGAITQQALARMYAVMGWVDGSREDPALRPRILTALAAVQSAAAESRVFVAEVGMRAVVPEEGTAVGPANVAHRLEGLACRVLASAVVHLQVGIQSVGPSKRVIFGCASNFPQLHGL
ncbi:hypothetical protein GPECTOR_11g213 [Gonium pectorale]|uniref:Uncharacterized protein n=1 Tax=Gonium pectorale TaxID=33097 RepID=A0A150GR00_GONPE|nr:hypothetical protein GPECTOR_11g213 [Gonium pectorale]|eukprot:KXZ51770.1 hypothetical protein GPECTOR_11g213 [Gonium pectorale]